MEDLKQYQDSFICYDKLYHSASTEKEKKIALEGMIRINFQLKKYEVVKKYDKLEREISSTQPN